VRYLSQDGVVIGAHEWRIACHQNVQQHAHRPDVRLRMEAPVDDLWGEAVWLYTCALEEYLPNLLSLPGPTLSAGSYQAP
jgi:hypothetical protein